MHITKTEKDMISLGETVGRSLVPPATIELIGDVGAGKTTFTKGLAKSLGITAPITSPSFTLSKSYHYKGKEQPETTALPAPRASRKTAGLSRLVHYDFYRLPDPGIMSEDLAESVSDPTTITIVEWAETVADILPKDRIIITIKHLDDDSRSVEISR